ncbi:MAG: hypothetical protein WBE48_02025, partial [Xanthobacteraceae bacterium]
RTGREADTTTHGSYLGLLSRITITPFRSVRRPWNAPAAKLFGMVDRHDEVADDWIPTAETSTLCRCRSPLLALAPRRSRPAEHDPRELSPED